MGGLAVRFWHLTAAASLVAALLAASINKATAGPVLLFEFETSRILASENEDAAWYPASLTKLMTAYLVFVALKQDDISPDALLLISPRANAQPAMRVGLGAGKRITVREALSGLIIKSANDLAVALAEAVSGSEDEFVADMNEMASKLGMVRTRFANANGLPKEGQVTTARDMAILTRAILRDFPEWATLFAVPEARVGTRTVHTHNDLLLGFEGADGMKTGFTCGAGYNIVASATRAGRKIIAVVLGERNNAARKTKAESLLQQAFSGPAAPPDARLIDPLPLNGEMLTDISLIAEPARAANFQKIRNCWPDPPLAPADPATSGEVTTVAADATAVPNSEQTAAIAAPKAARVISPAPLVRPRTAERGEATKKTEAKTPQEPGRPERKRRAKSVAEPTGETDTTE